MRLRNYQQAAVEAVFEEWKEVPTTLLVLPTGTGKTVVFAEIIRRIQPGRALVIAHREELIWQARDRIREFTGLDSEIEMGELFANNRDLFGDRSVVISTIQTQTAKFEMGRRMGRFKPEHFDLLIIDECHHSTANTYRDLIHYYTQNPKLRVLGVTATPDRADEEALGQVFKTVAYDYEILDAIRDGWLVDVDQQFVAVNGLDYSDIRTTAGDLNGGDLAKVMEAEHNLQAVASTALRIIGQRRAIVFTVSVRQAETVCEILNRHKPGCAGWVHGGTPKDDRRLLLADFASNKIQVIANCGVLTEGFDDPGVEVIIMARPTKSRSLYSQMVGRSTRPLKGVVDGLDSGQARREAIWASPKKNCLIVDFVGNSGKHKLMTTADVLGGKVSERALARAVALAQKAGKAVNMVEAIDQAQKWEEIERAKQVERLRRMPVKATPDYKVVRVNPFDAFDIRPVRERGWDRGRQLSEKQRLLLRKQGIDPDTLNYAAGRQLINELFNRWNKDLCTLRQAAVLKRFNYDTKTLTRKAASELLNRLADNHWRPLPQGDPQAAPSQGARPVQPPVDRTPVRRDLGPPVPQQKELIP